MRATPEYSFSSHVPLSDSAVRGRPHALESSERLHALDAYRAVLMLLGVLLHTIWFFQPVYLGAPLSDSQASWGHFYPFFWLHTFRMQAFFLIAGFFAQRMVAKRGAGSFLRNRLLHIGLPFLLCMLVLYPLMRVQFAEAGQISGRIQETCTPWEYFLDELYLIPAPLIIPMHFWFLECLLLLYACTGAIGLLARHVLDRSGELRAWCHARLARCVGAPWNFAVLAVPVGALMLYTNSWLGIFTGPIWPQWSGVFAYGVFYGVGWCAGRRPDLLTRAVRGWRWQLVAGTILAIGLSVVCRQTIEQGRLFFFYPLMAETEVRDYATFRARLLSARDERAAPALRAVWSQLPAPYQEFLERTDRPTADQLFGLAFTLDLRVIANLSFPEKWERRAPPLDERGRALLALGADRRSFRDTMELNRKMLESVLAPSIISRTDASWSRRLAYFYGYGVASWLLVFGTLGLFQHYCSGNSPVLRYLADSSYYFYLVHLPILFAWQPWLGSQDIAWPAKYVLYVVPTLIVIYVTYHFLVRPTPLGWLLTGSTHPVYRRTKQRT